MTYPVAIIGAGPVGLAAAAHLADRGEAFVLLEAGATAAASVQQWGHVRIFTPWRYAVDDVAVKLLQATGWTMPNEDEHPTGAELVSDYLRPLAELSLIRPNLRLATRVTAVARQYADKLRSNGRDTQPFVLTLQHADGSESQLTARAVIDASGTYQNANPLGANGVMVPGERANADVITYGIPDVLGADRDRYAGKRVLVVGSGHSAFNALLELAQLRQAEPNTDIVWAIRRSNVGQMFGGGDSDALAARGALGQRAEQLIRQGSVRLVTGVNITGVQRVSGGVVVLTSDTTLGEFDEIVCVTGFRPDYAMHRELRLRLDDTVEATPSLAPLIDPNLHSCGTVPPHGVDELSHPERDFYVIGMKSYGRAPTFLMLTGYEQARSVAAALAGDWTAARVVQLTLPETGVCSTDAGPGCCAPAPAAQIISPFNIAIN